MSHLNHIQPCTLTSQVVNRGCQPHAPTAREHRLFIVLYFFRFNNKRQSLIWRFTLLQTLRDRALHGCKQTATKHKHVVKTLDRITAGCLGFRISITPRIFDRHTITCFTIWALFVCFAAIQYSQRWYIKNIHWSLEAYSISRITCIQMQ